MPKALIVTPIKRATERVFYYPDAMHTIHNQQWRGQIDHFMPSSTDDHAIISVTRKYNQAREMAIAGDYDAILCAESDMLLPTDALEKLWRLDCDVAYGLYVWRTPRHEWNAYSELGVWEGKSLRDNETFARQAWGNVVEVVGVGLGCTLIHRHIFTAIPFRDREVIHCDHCLSIDLQSAKCTQLCDTSVICGHLDGDKVYYPDAEPPFFKEVTWPTAQKTI